MNRRSLMIATAASSVVSLIGSDKTMAQATPETSGNTTLYGNAFDLIPAGKPNTVNVVVIGAPVRETVPVVIRNSTNSAIGSDDITGVARDAAGKLIGTVEVGDVVPYVIEADGIGIGLAYFGAGNDLPVDAKFEFEVIYEEPESYHVDLTVIEVEVTDDGVLGIARNGSGQVVNGPNMVIGVFFDAEGRITGYCSTYTDKDEVDADATTPFNADFYGETITDAFLIGSVGWGDI